MRTSKIKPQPKPEIPAENPQQPALPQFPVIRERHPYLKIVWGDIQTIITMIRRKPLPAKQKPYDPLSAAHERSRRGW